MPSDIVLGAGGAAALVCVALLAIRPTATAGTAAGFAPWAVVVGLLHALRRAPAYPPDWARVLEWPGIAAIGVVLIGGAWLGASLFGGDEGAAGSYMASIGYGAAIPPLLVLASVAAGADGATVIAPVGIVIGSVVAGLVLYLLVARLRPGVTATGLAGGVLLFGHVLDATAGLVLLTDTAVVPGFARVATAVEDPFLAQVGYLGLRGILAVVALIVLTAWTRRQHSGHVGVGVVGSWGLAAGVHTIALAFAGLL